MRQKMRVDPPSALTAVGGEERGGRVEAALPSSSAIPNATPVFHMPEADDPESIGAFLGIQRGPPIPWIMPYKIGPKWWKDWPVHLAVTVPADFERYTSLYSQCMPRSISQGMAM